MNVVMFKDSRPPLARFVVDLLWINLNQPTLLRFVVDFSWIPCGLILADLRWQDLL